MEEITAIFGVHSKENDDVELVSSQEAKAPAKAQIDWSLDPPCMVRIHGDGFTEMAKMVTVPDSAFQIALFANGDRIESGYTLDLHF